MSRETDDAPVPADSQADEPVLADSSPADESPVPEDSSNVPEDSRPQPVRTNRNGEAAAGASDAGRARRGLSAADLERLREPPLQTADLPGVGGAIRVRPEDFRVREVPAYDPDGRPGAHVLLVLTKRGVGSEDAVAEVARQLGVPRPEVGLAGLKDKDAVTEQWISLPAAAAARLGQFVHSDISLGTAHPHGNKLRRGHLRGNRFTIVVRDPVVAVDEAVTRCRAKVERLRALGGLDNLYGEQRFGSDNLARGLAALARARRRGRADFLLSAGQSALFNLYLLERRARGLMREVLRGDILKKTATGGLFECTDPATDKARLDAGELVITGPMFGSKMRAPGPDTPSGALEAEILARAEIDLTTLQGLGHTLEGTRRPLQIAPLAVDVEAARDDFGPGVSLSFELPSGSYATALLRELQRPV
ncbi:tRNA pseudouridine(13) synthase TruD [Nannocystis punicea]|uniref:tRNA pseudouridine(13) synthase TruD n=1 Tax=Nannocystis punicea TaxID=2995304 RepID=A0ABY7H154_9BACT|nr:tRNA pseudouridine(13) synthase TruD [Nannocystis poenicansa]WAS92983.1 tRNA pseudouridine(13) synthase TruD [Nannocystis poenicansa]